MIDDSVIRERAYALWEKDSCPEGAAQFYWHLAREQLQAQVHAQESDARRLEFDNEKKDVLATFNFCT